MSEFQRGDLVVFRLTRHTNMPGPTMRDVVPEPRGEGYRYEVEKHWTVSEVQSNGHLILVTRSGRQLTVETGDRRLRRASLWQRLLYSAVFPQARPTG